MPRKTVTKTVIEEPKDAPSVVAYRVGEVERALKEGFEGVHKGLAEIKDGLVTFVTHKQFEEAEEVASKKHEDYEKRLRSLEKDRNKGKGAIALLAFLIMASFALIAALWWLRK